ncbi:hypothetical protein ABIA33_005787 [Streptacidiphilus sp. MAP12-16]|uniref:ATP-binding protein n=1 Tax=Streptacidiphilus sp. MAP12-16 TaxID=3156300 RepID=UPI0035162E03
MMNPHTVGGGSGSESRPPHDTDSPTLARIPADQIPVGPAPVGQTAAGRIPAGQAPADQTPVQHAAAETSPHLPVRQRDAASAELVRTTAPAVDAAAETVADGSARTGVVVTGELWLTVNAPDGSTVVDCPPGLRPQPVQAPADPLVRPRSASGLLERDALCERLRALLLQGRSVRLVGPAGSGRSAILDAVAGACSGLAPAGVVQLSGYSRTSGDLLQDLFAATHHAPGHRPGRALMPDLLRDLCAIVVVDDVEFSGEALEDLLAAAPECSFLLSSTPEVATPLTGSRLEESRLPGLSRQSSLALLARLAGRTLDETERAWAVDLWFESEGLPLRFVQAAALLRHREAAIEAMAAGLPGPEWLGPATAETSVDLLSPQRTSGAPVDPAVVPVRPSNGSDGPGPAGRGDGEAARPTPGGFEAYLSQHGKDDVPLPDPVPLPSVAESAAPAVRIARGLSVSARRTLRLATALGGECPSAPHLPALIDVGHGEAALDELVEAGLATAAGTHHRLVEGVAALLAEEWPDEEAARAAAQHFAWWTGHASVTEQQIADEAEVLLATMHADREAGRHQQVVLLARASAPAFALALRWGAWERALRFGLESARATAAVAEEAWFHHELGVLALCVGAYDRSRAELEASVALRGALGDARGTATGRQALERLDRAGTTVAGGTVVIGVRATPGMPGFRRILPFARQSTDDGRVTRRQVMLAVASVVLMGALGAGVAVAVGAFTKVGAGTGVTVPQVVTSTDPAAPSPTDTGGALPAASASSGTPKATASSSSSVPPSSSSSPNTSPSSSPSDTPSPTLSPSTPPQSPTTKPSPSPSPTHTSPSPSASASSSPSASPSPSTSTPTGAPAGSAPVAPPPSVSG